MEEIRVNLIKPREQAKEMITGHIAKGKSLLETAVSNQAEFDDARAAYKKWKDYAKQLLSQLFNNDSMAKRLNRHGGVIIMGSTSLAQRYEDYRKDFSANITTLESIEEMLPLIDEPEQLSVTAKPAKKATSNRVFVVHGSDAGVKSEVARFLEKIGLDPIILHEQPNEGQTIIEKFEAHSGSTNYAIIILSPDDVGSRVGDSEKARPRARQNVVFEWGYFIGKLGRNRVNALYFSGVELPSDNQGVVYTAYDENGAWQLLTAKELKKAGYDVDMNLLT